MIREKKSWLDEMEYPFLPHYYDTKVGKIHYVDEGSGKTIVFVHGNPSWSFTWRKLIKGLSGQYRCIAIDHIGFGFSDKPIAWSYLPHDHAANFEQFINHLALKNITLAVNDWGGPIGLSYAIRHPENVKRIILCNTWMWSQKGNKQAEQFSKFMGGGIGKFLTKNFNFFARFVANIAAGDKNKFPGKIRKCYYKHLEKPADRKGSWVFPGEIINSSDWLEGLWQQNGKIKDIPTLVIWGAKDRAFKKDILDKWKSFLSNKQIIELETTGHFPQEEMGDELIEPIKQFLQNS